MIEYQKQARQEGCQEGQRQTFLKELHHLLAFRFSIPVGHFDDQFQRLELTALEQLNDAVFTVSSRAEFEDLQTPLLSPPDALKARQLEGNGRDSQMLTLTDQISPSLAITRFPKSAQFRKPYLKSKPAPWMKIFKLVTKF